MERRQRIADRYVLTSPIGQGGMAEVWCARDERLDRDVAVKFLAPRLADDPEFLVRFFSEAQGVARISDPAVVSVLDFGQEDGRPYLVMEYVGGGAVTELDLSSLATEKAIEIVAQTARGAGAVHAEGIVHRDIKPANILLDPFGDAKLADFGIAANTGAERLTATGTAIGSPHYISPEQVSGLDATPASDVYSLGVVLYELLTGVKPFDGENVTAIAISHVEKEPEPPSVHDSEIEPWLDAVVMRCLAKDPNDRFPDGRALAAALKERRVTAPAASPIAAPDDDLIAPAERRSYGVATVLIMGLLLGLAALALVAAGGEDDPAVATTTESPAPRARPSESPSPSVSMPTTEPAAMEARPSASPSPSPETEDKKEKDETMQEADEPAEEPAEEEAEEPEPTPSPDPEPEPTVQPTPEGKADPEV